MTTLRSNTSLVPERVHDSHNMPKDSSPNRILKKSKFTMSQFKEKLKKRRPQSNENQNHE